MSGKSSRFFVILCLIAAVGLSSGCKTVLVDSYEHSIEPIEMRLPRDDFEVYVTQFTRSAAAGNAIACSPDTRIEAPAGMTMVEFVREALVTELSEAELYAENSTMVLHGHVDTLEYVARDLTWNIVLTLRADDDRPSVSFETSRRLKFDWRGNLRTGGNANCENARRAFVDVVRQLVRDALESEEFRNLTI